jgi:hypothetical protein
MSGTQQYIPQLSNNDPQGFLLGDNIIGDFNTTTVNNSGNGALPAAEKNQTYFAYFSSVGGTGPEIIDQTAYFIKYLIDAQGNVVSPQPNSIDILNMLQNFEAGRVVNVTSLEGTTLFTTLLGTKQITNVGRIQPILITETGSGRTEYITTMSFSAGPGGVGLDSAYNYSFTAKKAASAFISNTSFATLDFGTEINDSGSNYNNGSYIYTFPNNTTTQGTQVSFIARIVAKSAFSGPNQNGRSNYLRFQIQRSTDGVNYSPLELTDGTYTRLQYFNNDDTVKSQTAQTKPLNFNTGDRIRVQYSVDSGGVENQLRILAADNDASTYFSNTQTYIANNFITSPYWTIGTYTTASNDFTILTASLGLTGLNQNQYSQVTPPASLTFGFSNITLPFTPEPGDFIRFEYDPNNVHVIYENLTTTGGNLALKVVPPVPSGSILDHFCIYRVNPNAGNQIILNVPKPTGTTGQPLTGFIKPQYMSKELEDNFTTIIQKLAAEGTIQ